jgi:hypothetical protein
MKTSLNSFAVLIISLFIFANCIKPNTSEQVAEAELPEDFQKMLTAHGGLEKWKSFGTMEFDVVDEAKREHHTIDLYSRKDLIVADSFKIGFDGSNVWVAPTKKSFKGPPARFYHSLVFYFASIPYVLADKGVQYDQPDTLSLNGKVYKTIKCYFQSGVGDADADSYKVCIDPDTQQMEYLLYNSTYFSGKSSEKYNLIHYQDKKEINGLLLPHTLQWYSFVDGKIGEPRGNMKLENFKLTSDTPSPDLFVMPGVAEIDSLSKK